MSLASWAQFSSPQVLYEVQTNMPDRITMADLDNDGINDILVSCSNPFHGLSWFKLDAGGNTVAHASIADLAVDARFDVTDLDGDDDLDIVLIGTRIEVGGQTHGLWSIENLGQGHFDGAECLFPGAFPSFALGDMDGDGDEDILTGQDSNDLYINDGSGAFVPLGLSLWLASEIALVDLDADGDLDIYMPGYFWYEQQGAVFIEHVAENLVDCNQTWDALLLYDMENDGDLDVLTYYDNIEGRIGWNENTGTGDMGPSQSIHVYSSIGLLHSTPADWDLDGDLDILTTTRDNFGQDWLSWLSNTGGMVYDAPQPIAILPSAGTCVIASDLNADGLMDVVIPGDNNLIYRAFGTGGAEIAGFAVVNQYDHGIAPTTWPPQFSDVDQDGRMDMVWGGLDYVAWTRKVSGGTFEHWPTPINSTLTGPHTTMVGDLDGDGDVDVASAAYAADSLVWFANNGDGTDWIAHTIGYPDAPRAGGDPVDLDQDGDLDLLTISGSSDQNIRCWKNNGAGTFSVSTIGTVYNTYRVFHDDIDGDTDLDVIVSAGAEITWFINDGNANFSGPAGTLDRHGFSTTVLDMEGDGDPDIIAPDLYQDSMMWYVNDGTGSFEEGATIISGTNGPLEFFLVDLDADGDKDMVYVLGIAHLAAINSGNGTFSLGEPLPAVFGQLEDAWARDMDGDGDDDVVRSVPSSGCLWGWENYALNPQEIRGTVFFDPEQDGILGSDDEGLECLVSCVPSELWSLSAQGSYRFSLDVGAFEIQPALTSPHWQLTSDSASYHLALNTPDTLIEDLDFGFYPGPDTTSAVLSFTSDPTKCGTVVNMYIDIANMGNTILRGELVAELDSLIDLQSSTPAPTSIAGHTITWTIDSIFYLATGHIELQCLMPDYTSMGDSVHVDLSMATTDAFGNVTGDFGTEWSSLITCAFDPNDKLVSPQGYGDLGSVPISTEYLDYTIRFQNTGTDTAADVMIRDGLISGLMPSTIQILGASHDLTDMFIESDAEVVFVFSGIMLPDSNVNEPNSHGYIRFRVRLQDDLPHGTTLPNTAGIIFDTNPPVITNTVLTTLIDCGQFAASITEPSPGVLVASEGMAYQWFLNGVLLSGEVEQQLVTFTAGDFTVEVRNSHGCLLTSPVHYVTETSIAVTSMRGCSIYPNPFTDATSIRFYERLRPSDVVQMLDTDGRVLLEVTGLTTTGIVLDRAGRSTGLYLVRVLREGLTVAVGRLAIE